MTVRKKSFYCTPCVPDNNGLLLQEREKDRMRFQPPSDNDRDLDRGGPSSAAASRVQDIVGGALGALNMANNMMGGAVNLGGGNLTVQLLNQLGIDPSLITNQVFVANVSTLLSNSALHNPSILNEVC